MGVYLGSSELSSYYQGQGGGGNIYLGNCCIWPVNRYIPYIVNEYTVLYLGDKNDDLGCTLPQGCAPYNCFNRYVHRPNCDNRGGIDRWGCVYGHHQPVENNIAFWSIYYYCKTTQAYACLQSSCQSRPQIYLFPQCVRFSPQGGSAVCISRNRRCVRTHFAVACPGDGCPSSLYKNGICVGSLCGCWGMFRGSEMCISIDQSAQRMDEIILESGYRNDNCVKKIYNNSKAKFGL